MKKQRHGKKMFDYKSFNVFICTNETQEIGAKVSRYSILKNENWLSEDQIHILHVDDHKQINPLFGKKLKDGKNFRTIEHTDMQTFSLLRFLPPSIEKFSGYCLIIDPDVFSVKSGLQRQLDEFILSNNSIMAKPSGNGWASSVMFTNNQKLKHWKFKTLIDDLISQKIDYRELMSLISEIREVSVLPNKLNSFDELNDDTILLHTTNRLTQPWRAGLKFNSFKTIKPVLGFIPRKLIWRLLGRPTWDLHIDHPSQKITSYFFELAGEALAKNLITEKEIERAQSNKWIRADFLDVIKKNQK
jgi:hypothetical protein